MMSFRTLILIASVAYVANGNVVKRSFGHHYSVADAPAPVSSYGFVAPAPALAPAAPAPALAAPVPVPVAASSYGASSYGAPPSLSYPAPAAQAYGPIFYLEEDRPSYNLKTRIHDFKSRIFGGLGYMKGSILAAKGQMLMKKANIINKKGERLVGLGETLKSLRYAHASEPLMAPVHQTYYSAPALPAAPGY